MLAKRWVGAALVLGAVLVVGLWSRRESLESAPPQRNAAARVALRESHALEAPLTSARAMVARDTTREESDAAVEDDAELEALDERAPLGRLLGVVRGLTPEHSETALVLCEFVHLGRHFIRSATLGPEGDFELDNLDTDRQYLLRVRLGEHGRELARSDRIEFGARELERRVELIVGAHATKLVVRVRDEAGLPVARAPVRTEAVESDAGAPRCLFPWVAAAATDDSGEVVFAPVAPATWNVEVRDSQHASVTAQVDVHEGRTNEVAVVLRAGLELRGRLITTRGAPAGRTRVAFTFADSASGVTTWMLPSVDDDGRLVLRNAPDTELTPQVDRSAGRNAPSPRLTFGWSALPPVRPGRGEVELTVPELCTLVGRCVDELPTPQLYVSAHFEHEFAQALVRLDSEGRFALPLEPRAGPLRLQLQPHDDEARPRTRAGRVVDVAFPEPGGVLDVGEIEFVREPVLVGVVQSANGASAANLRVQLEFDRPHQIAKREAWCDSQGRFEFEAAPESPGVLRIRYESAGQAELRLDNVAAAARAGEVSLALQPPARVVGRVHWSRAAHRGPPLIALIGSHEDGRRIEEQRVVARESGEFELSEWPSNYELWLQWLGDETWVRGPRVTLGFGRVTPLEWTVD